MCTKCEDQKHKFYYLLDFHWSTGQLIFTAQRYASAVLGVVILSVRPSVRPSVTRVLCDQSKEPTGDIFIPHERQSF